MTQLTITNWHKSSFSDGASDCVEYGSTAQEFAVRDTKQDGRGPALVWPKSAHAAFRAAVTA